MTAFSTGTHRDATSAGPAGLEAVDGRTFRDCIARLPSGVHVVTTDGAAGVGGFTATAVASVSDAPPVVLACLNRSSPQTSVFRENGVFAVNLLPAGARVLADTFAGRTGLAAADRFAPGDWERLATGSPILKAAVMSLDCRLLKFDEVGTHTVFFGVVVGARSTTPGGGPDILIYHDRHYSEV